MNELNAALAAILGMAVLLTGIMLNSVNGCRWLAAKLDARAFFLENARAEAARYRHMADERFMARMREYEVRQ